MEREVEEVIWVGRLVQRWQETMDREDGCLLRIAMEARMVDGNQDGGMIDGNGLHVQNDASLHIRILTVQRLNYKSTD